MRVVPLGSGSRGNATLVEFGGPGGLFGSTRLLLDAGLSAKELNRRLEAIGVDPAGIEAVLLSHEHDDHTRGAERFSRRFGIPVLCSPTTLEAMDRSPRHFAAWKPLAAGHRTEVGAVSVEPFPVPHDAADPLGFVMTGGGLRFGMVTDLGHATEQVVERLRGCQVLMIESNHDDRMLHEGPYPPHLKRRVSGRLGHLSNREAGELLRETVDGGCRAVVLAHLSEKNNTHELARRSALAALEGRQRRAPEIRVAAHDRPTEPVCLWRKETTR
jgi:phosphoribosyl 1,2-cyclic phosphodiesterase